MNVKYLLILLAVALIFLILYGIFDIDAFAFICVGIELSAVISVLVEE